MNDSLKLNHLNKTPFMGILVLMRLPPLITSNKNVNSTCVFGNNKNAIN